MDLPKSWLFDCWYDNSEITSFCFEIDESTSQLLFYVPGLDVNNIKLTLAGRILSLRLKDDLGTVRITRTYRLREGYSFKESVLQNGVLYVKLSSSSDDEEKELEINIPQPSAKTHPSLLNEDSDI